MSSSLDPDHASPAGDEELMIAVSRGDLGAFEQLVLRHQTSAWNAAFRFLGDHAEAEDVVQDAFLKIYDAAPRYEVTAKFRTYLYRVVTRLCIDRAERKRPRYGRDVPEISDSGDCPLKTLTSAERQQQIRRALDGLPPNQRMAVILKYFDCLSSAEIAASMEITTKAVERLLARARESLESLLAGVMG